VYSRAEGNPFFAEELVALGSADAVPVTVRDLLEARIDALPGPTRRVVRAAAAAGRRVEHALLRRAVDLDEQDLDDALCPAVDAHVLVPDGDAYVFRHALLHETVAAGLLPGERARVHRRLAEALAANPALATSRHGLESRIAHHWLAAGAPVEGRIAAYRAATAAVRTLAFDEALRHYERVVELSGDADDLPVPRYRLLWDAAEAAHRAGAADRAAVLVQEAIACVDPAQPHHRAYLYERLGRYLWTAAEGVRALEAYRQAVELVPTEPVTSWQAAVVSGHAQVLVLTGRFADGRAEAERALALAAQVADGRPIEGRARDDLGVALAHLGEVDRGIAELRTAAAIAREQSDVDEVARAVVDLHRVLFDAGRFADALSVALDGIATVDQLGLQRRKGIWCRCDAVGALLVLGRTDEAEALLREAVLLNPEGVDAVRVHALRGAHALRRGRLDEARRQLELARRTGRSVVDGHLMLPIARALLETLRWQGDWPAAVELAREVLARDWADGEAAYLVPVLAMATGAAADGAVAAHAERRTTEERRLAALAADFAGRAAGAASRPDVLLPPARTALAVARAERARTSREGAARAWGDVADAWQELGDRYSAGTALLRQAECQLADRRRAAASDTLRAARAAAIAVRAQHLLRAVEATAARARLPLEGADPEPDDRFRLSARERDVLALVARGRTDRQIGAELFISHRTVERHVSNILAKLDAHTRAELTAIAHRQGLVVPVPRRPARPVPRTPRPAR
jgi:DNA-binding CsgD family transcriptional regulator